MAIPSRLDLRATSTEHTLRSSHNSLQGPQFPSTPLPSKSHLSPDFSRDLDCSRVDLPARPVLVPRRASEAPCCATLGCPRVGLVFPEEAGQTRRLGQSREGPRAHARVHRVYAVCRTAQRGKTRQRGGEAEGQRRRAGHRIRGEAGCEVADEAEAEAGAVSGQGFECRAGSFANECCEATSERFTWPGRAIGNSRGLAFVEEWNDDLAHANTA